MSHEEITTEALVEGPVERVWQRWMEPDHITQSDRLYRALLADGGEESPCAWLTDRCGVSWQIVPDALPCMLGANDRDAVGRAMQAMLKMTKIDIAELESAFRGKENS